MADRDSKGDSTVDLLIVGRGSKIYRVLAVVPTVRAIIYITLLYPQRNHWLPMNSLFAIVAFINALIHHTNFGLFLFR